MKILFKCKKGAVYRPGAELINKLRSAYPGADIEQQLHRAAAWCEAATEAERKTSRGMGRFLNSWLRRSSEGPAKGSGRQTQAQALAAMAKIKAAEEAQGASYE